MRNILTSYLGFCGVNRTKEITEGTGWSGLTEGGEGGVDAHVACHARRFNGQQAEGLDAFTVVPGVKLRPLPKTKRQFLVITQR